MLLSCIFSGKRCVFVVVEEGSRSALGPSQSLFQQEEMSNHNFLHIRHRPVSLLHFFFFVEIDLYSVFVTLRLFTTKLP